MNDLTRRQQGDLADKVRDLLRTEIDNAEYFINHVDRGAKLTRKDYAILEKLHHLLPVLNKQFNGVEQL